MIIFKSKERFFIIFENIKIKYINKNTKKKILDNNRLVALF